MNFIKFFTGPVMSGKTKLMSDFINLLHPSEYSLVVPSMIFKNIDNPIIKSRSEGYPGYKPNILVDDKVNLYDTLSKMDNLRAVFCEEIQFFSHSHIDQLHRLATKKNIKIYCFGIESDHKRNKWSTVEYLEKKCISQQLSVGCKFCNELATCNIRHDFNISAKSVDPGHIENNEEKFLPCCNNCWVNLTSKK